MVIVASITVEFFEWGRNAMGKLLEAALDILKLAPSSDKWGSVYSIVRAINEGILALALPLTVMVFLYGMFKSTTDLVEFKSPVHLFKALFRYGISLAFVRGSMFLVESLFKIFDGFRQVVQATMDTAFPNAWTSDLPRIVFNAAFNLAQETAPAGSPQFYRAFWTAKMPSFVTEDLAESIDASDQWLKLFIFIFVVMAALALMVMGAMIVIHVYTRIFKIWIYMAIAPLPLAFFASESTRQSGFSFLKTYVGVIIQGLLLIVIFAIFSYLPIFTFLGSESPIYMILGVVVNAGILLGIVKGSDMMVREIMG